MLRTGCSSSSATQGGSIEGIFRWRAFKYRCANVASVWFQFLATLKIMDYSLLVGIHDVDRAEQEEMDVEGVGEEDDYENDGMGGGVLTGSFGTPPDSPGNPLNCGGFFGPGEFDPSVDVYAIKSRDGEETLTSVCLRRGLLSEKVKVLCLPQVLWRKRFTSWPSLTSSHITMLRKKLHTLLKLWNMG